MILRLISVSSVRLGTSRSARLLHSSTVRNAGDSIMFVIGLWTMKRLKLAPSWTGLQPICDVLCLRENEQLSSPSFFHNCSD